MQDARSLLKARRYDGAGYHAGYVVECVAKTMLQLEGKLSQKHLAQVGPEALKLATVATSPAARYIRAETPLAPAIERSKDPWRPDMRYHPEGYVTKQQGMVWVQEASTLLRNTILQMRLDGVL
jgi:hypothetical protein